MTPPPLPAVVVAGGLAWNYARSRRRNEPRKPTISRWACINKRAAVSVAVVGGTWLTVHWARYVIDTDTRPT